MNEYREQALNILKKMDLKAKLGQLVMCGFEDPYYDEHARILIEDYKVGNIILFSRNVKDMEQLVKLNKDIYKEVYKNTGLLPFISIDQEGGMVTRIMNGATFCPGNMTISASNNPQYAYDIGQIMGEELTHLGINLNLAPSLDTNNNPKNPVIGVRSYSDNPNRVAEYGLNYIKGLQSEGVLATAKHFPGHGDTSVDSHLGLATIEYDMNRLNSIELLPFKKAIDDGVKAIMTAHIIFKCLDDVPATLSENVLGGLLRKELGFEGLIVSDCMQMKAIDNLYTTEKGTVRGIKAGLNIACVCHTLERQIGALKAIEEAIKNGELSMEIIDERVLRVIEYKLSIKEKTDSDFLNLNDEEISKYFKKINEHKEKAQEVCDASLTLAYGKPFEKVGKTLVIGNVPFASTIAEDKLNSRNAIDMIKDQCKGVETLFVDTNPTNFNEVISKAKDFDTVLYITYNVGQNQNQTILASKLQEVCKNFYVLSSRNPYDCLYLNEVENITCLYEYTPVSINTMVKYVNGAIKPNGVLPVKVSKRIPVGASIYLGLKDYTLEDNIKYLELLKKHGLSYVFISGQMEEAGEGFNDELKTILKYAKENGFRIILDVNKQRLKELENNNLIDGVFALRLDYGFSYDEILAMQDKPYYIEMNASTISPKLLDFLKSNNANFKRYRLSHNFFPKPYTGMSFESIKEKNEMFHSYGFTVMAYMPTFVNRRPPLYLGLPTIEDQRYNNVTANISELLLCGVDTVFFGDAFATEEEIEEAVNHDKEYILVPIELKDGVTKEMLDVLLMPHHNRPDNSEYMIRSSVRRNNIIEFNNNIIINKKDVTIDNFNNGRYQGEVGIALKEMKASKAVNVVGKCLCNDYLIDNIKGNAKFKFVIKENK